MLKFSGLSCLISGQKLKFGCYQPKNLRHYGTLRKCRKDRSKLSLPNTNAHWAKCQVQELGRTGPLLRSQIWWSNLKIFAKLRPEPSHHTKVWSIINDTETNMLPGYPESAICVQRFDDSLNSAIHITYRNWLRSSSMHEPRDPPLKVVKLFLQVVLHSMKSVVRIGWLEVIWKIQAHCKKYCKYAKECIREAAVKCI